MSRRVVPLSLDNVGELPDPCRTCVFWELGHRGQAAAKDPVADKESWLSTTLLDWGSCGSVLLVDGAVAGYALYAPAAQLAGLASFATAPIAADAVALAALRVVDGQVGAGFGRLLVQSMARDLTRRGVRAVEAIASEAGTATCLIPAGFLLAVGFKTVRPHPSTPRLRLDLRNAVTWDLVEATLGRLRPARAVGAYRSVEN
jgi:GNAT superfamily N-acetyltransferase